MIKGFEDIVKRYKPFGYELVRRKVSLVDAQVNSVREIVLSSSLEGRDGLFVFLHECGHIALTHLRTQKEAIPRWQEEYEADQFAITTMRKEGVSIPKDRLNFQKSEVRRLILADGDAEVPPDAILKYAFGKEWRKHR